MLQKIFFRKPHLGKRMYNIQLHRFVARAAVSHNFYSTHIYLKIARICVLCIFGVGYAGKSLGSMEPTLVQNRRDKVCCRGTSGQYRLHIRELSTSNSYTWRNSNNDPLQDYIRRSCAGQVCYSNRSSHERKVYSTLSTERDNPLSRRGWTGRYISSCQTNVSQRPYVLSSNVRSKNSYQSLLKQKRVNDNRINSVYKKQLIEKNAEEGSLQSNIERNTSALRLDFIEHYARENINQFGFVPLNEKILSELATAISECLSKKIIVDRPKCETMYEPISPAETDVNSEY